jgi:hypothetical protein
MAQRDLFSTPSRRNEIAHRIKTRGTGYRQNCEIPECKLPRPEFAIA